MLPPLSQLAVTLFLSLSPSGKHLSIRCKEHSSFSPVTFFHFAVHCSQQDRTTFPCSALPQLFDQCLWALLPSVTVSSLQRNTPSQCLWAEQPVFQWSNSFFVSRAQQLWAMLTKQHCKQGKHRSGFYKRANLFRGGCWRAQNIKPYGRNPSYKINSIVIW